MQPRIVFLVMSAVARPETVDQLAHALRPHVALVHHDATQQPGFRLRAPNVRWVPDPRRTGWADFGFVEGIFHSLRHALANLDFDYLQLLSPSCLPIKPLARFEAEVATGVDAHFDCLDLFGDRDVLMNVAYRAFTPQQSLRHRIARRATDIYFGDSTGRRDVAGIWLRSGGGRGVVPRAAGAFLRALARASDGRLPFDAQLRPCYGTAWFGARREIVAGMVGLFERPGVREAFGRLRIPEEFMFPSMLTRLARTKGPMNHEHKRFQGARTGIFDIGDRKLLLDSRAFFARKFPDDPAAPIRRWVLAELLRGEPPMARIAVQPASHAGGCAAGRAPRAFARGPDGRNAGGTRALGG